MFRCYQNMNILSNCHQNILWNQKTSHLAFSYKRPLEIVSRRSFSAISFSPSSKKTRIIFQKVTGLGIQPLSSIFTSKVNASSTKPSLQNPLIIILYVHTSGYCMTLITKTSVVKIIESGWEPNLKILPNTEKAKLMRPKWQKQLRRMLKVTRFQNSVELHLFRKKNKSCFPFYLFIFFPMLIN